MRNKHYWFSLLILLIAFKNQASINDCEAEHRAYNNIQQRMKQPYSFTQGEKLRSKERSLFNLYQECMSGHAQHKKSIKHRTYKQKIRKNKAKLTQKKIPNALNLSTTRTLIIKGKFNGEMQNAWLKHYKKPKECNRPKSTADFAWCIEHKNKAAKAFEKRWQKAKK